MKSLKGVKHNNSRYGRRIAVTSGRKIKSSRRKKKGGDTNDVYLDICHQTIPDSRSDVRHQGFHTVVKKINNLNSQEKNTNEIRKGNRKGLMAQKWKTSLSCLLRADWTQCKVDRTAKRYDSNSRRSGKRRGMKWRKKIRR